VPTLTDNQRKQVRFLTPDQVFSFLESLELKRTPAAVHGSKELLTAKELEELLRIDVKTIYSYVQRGLIPYVRIQSNLRFVKSEVLAWLSQRQFQPKARSRDLVGK
jgi:excisionase family DNA binding protein